MTRTAGPRVLLLGASGMLGRALAQHLPTRFSTCVPAAQAAGQDGGVAVLSSALDARDVRTLDAVLAEAAADVVINCIAVTPASPRYQDAEETVAVNALFPHQVASRVVACGGRFVHLSTDGVFSGARGGYREADLADPIDLYGRSKLAGEIDAAGCLTIRTTFFGRSARGRGLIEWLLAHPRGVVEGYTDYVFSGLATPVLAEIIGDLIEQRVDGLLHVGGQPVSKFDVLAAAARVLNLNVEVRRGVRGQAMDRSLDTTRLRAVLRRRIPTLDAMMETLKTPVAVPHRA